MHGYTCIGVFKKAIDKWPCVVCYIKNSYSTKELRNKAVLNLKQYCLLCYVAPSNIYQLFLR